ncbi:MAG: hypothetical protein JXB62_00950 [Pirellulales bacterium]|nr:hypothetical protein [Pirellulales bacterium]
MNLRTHVIAVVAAGWVLVTFEPAATAAANTDATVGGTASARASWQQRVLRSGQATRASVATHRKVQWTPHRQMPASTVSMRTGADVEPVRLVESELEPVQEEVDFHPLPPDNAYDSYEVADPETILHEPEWGGCADCGGGCEQSACGGCEGCGGCSGGCGYWTGPPRWTRNLSLFAGVQGFKGPFDQGRNGNFGMHFGVNTGLPILRRAGIGVQAGMAAVYSNFSGHNVDRLRTGERPQLFFTTGVFRRAVCGGVQGGIAFDLVRDHYYDSADLSQVRTELGFVSRGGRREVGYFGAYGTKSDVVTEADLTTFDLVPTDMHACYYRHYFDNGGEGRFWAGLTGEGDGLLGADSSIPLGKCWSVLSRFNYLMPRQYRGAGGLAEESWGLTIQLVFYPGRSSQNEQNNPLRPLFPVADNSLLMADVF